MGVLALIMIIAAVSPAGAMTFRPAKMRMWDVWVFYHEETYYLFYDIPASLGLATSSDGVHWRDCGVIIKKPDTAMLMGSGFT